MYNNPVGQQNTLTVPYDSSEICNAAKNFAEKKKITVRRSGIIDKMSVMRFYSGLPMYAYQGIQELERAYEADKKPGRHLFSCFLMTSSALMSMKEQKWRMFFRVSEEGVPNISPLTSISSFSSRRLMISGI